jgi:Phosphoesterase family
VKQKVKEQSGIKYKRKKNSLSSITFSLFNSLHFSLLFKMMMKSFTSLTVGLTTLMTAVSGTAIVRDTFKSPTTAPGQASSIYNGANNGTLKNGPIVSGKSFDRIINIWLENTDFEDAATISQFQKVAEQGVLMNSYYAVTHPSEPNYLASVFGDFFGLGDDDYWYVPNNITNLFDVLNDGKVSWACYEENMPFTGYQQFNYSQPNYVSPNATKPYTYYVRKHNPCAFAQEAGTNADYAIRNRNFNDFAADLNASALPQWMFITPNMVNDAHDSTVQYVGNWTDYWLLPLLENPKFNDNRTLILLTFDENENYGENNQIFTVALGGALPSELKNTTDSTYYTHYSSISTVEANWGLKNLGRGDVQKGMNNVFDWVAKTTGFKNQNVTGDAIPLTNLTGIFNGPFNPDQTTLFYAPNDTNVIGAGGQAVLVKDGLDKSITLANVKPVNMTALKTISPFDSIALEFAKTNPVAVGGNKEVNVSTGATVVGSSATTSSHDGASSILINVGLLVFVCASSMATILL